MTASRLIGTVASAGGILIAIAWIAAYTSGWSTLAVQFSYRGSAPTTMLNTDRIVLSRPGGTPSTLGGTIRAAVTSDGLYFAQSGPFRLFARPLLIPWKAVSSYSRTNWGSHHPDTNIFTIIDIEISIPDPGNVVLSECRRHLVPEVKKP
jgi:hypothetical protein